MQVSGRIVAVQEQRFRFAADSGQILLLTLGRHAPLDAAALVAFKHSQAHLQVDFSGEPNLSGGVAHNLREVGR